MDYTDNSDNMGNTLEKMKMKLCKFSLYPKLYEPSKYKAQRHYKFACSWDPSGFPGIRAKWLSDENLILMQPTIF